MEGIHVKESVIKQFPNMCQNFINPLFIENGIMPDRKGGGKTKTCIIYINYAGVFFLRPNYKLSKSYKISKQISLDSIESIVFTSAKRRTLIVKYQSPLFFECSHINDSIGYIVSAKKYLADGKEIKLTDFPSNPRQYNLMGNYTKSMLRYLTLCVKYKEDPKESIINVFSNIDAAHHPIITLDSKCECPRNFMILAVCIGNEQITTLRLINFAPYIACRLVHFVIKGSPTVKNIIFENYSVMIPAQLRMETIKTRKILSFSFKGCRFHYKICTELIDTISKYNGSIQRLTFDDIQLSTESWNYIWDSLAKYSPWKTLECIEFDNMDSTMLQMDQASFTNTLRHFRFLQHLSLSNWNPPFCINLKTFHYSFLLFQLILHKQNFSEPFNEKIQFPVTLNYIDLSGSSFTFVSLQSFFKVLSSQINQRQQLILGLADLNLPSEHWPSFLRALPNLPAIKSLRGLDWSGNMIDGTQLDVFCHYFLQSNGIVHLKLDRIFNPQRIDDLKALINSIAESSLISLSIGGDQRNNFADKMKLLFDAIRPLGKSLKILHINGQKITDKDCESVIEFLRSSNQIVEFSMDRTSISDENGFFNFYSGLFQLPNISIVGRPTNDLHRIFGGPSLPNLYNKSSYSSFKTRMQQKIEVADAGAFAFYVCTNLASSAKFDGQKYAYFVSMYPPIFQSLNNLDEFSLGYKARHYPSLLSVKVNQACKTLEDIQGLQLKGPKFIPVYSPTNEKPLQYLKLFDSYEVEASLMNPLESDPMAASAMNQRLYGSSNLRSDMVKLEPLQDTPEFLDVIDLILHKNTSNDEATIDTLFGPNYFSGSSDNLTVSDDTVSTTNANDTTNELLLPPSGFTFSPSPFELPPSFPPLDEFQQNEMYDPDETSQQYNTGDSALNSQKQFSEDFGDSLNREQIPPPQPGSIENENMFGLDPETFQAINQSIEIPDGPPPPPPVDGQIPSLSMPSIIPEQLPTPSSNFGGVNQPITPLPIISGLQNIMSNPINIPPPNSGGSSGLNYSGYVSPKPTVQYNPSSPNTFASNPPTVVQGNNLVGLTPPAQISNQSIPNPIPQPSIGPGVGVGYNHGIRPLQGVGAQSGYQPNGPIRPPTQPGVGVQPLVGIPSGAGVQPGVGIPPGVGVKPGVQYGSGPYPAPSVGPRMQNMPPSMNRPQQYGAYPSRGSIQGSLPRAPLAPQPVNLGTNQSQPSLYRSGTLPSQSPSPQLIAGARKVTSPPNFDQSRSPPNYQPR